MTSNPDVQAHVNRLATDTGIPAERFMAWLASDPPPGISRDDWADCAANSGALHAPAVAGEVLAELRRMAAHGGQASSVEAA